MSRMRTLGKPPLAKSPVRLRPRRVIRSNASASLQTPPGSLTKSQKRLSPTWSEEETGMLRPEYQSISYELRALARMVNDGLDNGDSALSHTVAGVKSNSRSNSSLFERGRLYEEYSARRNERLNSKRRCGNNKMSSEASRDLKTPSYKAGLGVTVESSKKGRDSKTKVAESFRKSVSAAYCSSALQGTPAAAAAASAAANSTPRYMLRSMSKESRKPATATAIPLPSAVAANSTRRTRRIQGTP